MAFQLEQHKFYLKGLKPGMYVSSLDRPWLETPFPVQGFLIQNQADVDQLNGHCDFVYVDFKRSSKDIALQFQQKITYDKNSLAPHRKLASYKDTQPIEQEFSAAQKAVANFDSAVKNLYSEYSKNTPLKMSLIRAAADPVVDSVTRNPDACMWLARLKTVDTYTYKHAVAVSIWCVALGRQIGLPRQDLKSLALGGTLFDLGKGKLPNELLEKKERLTKEDQAKVRKHVEYAVTHFEKEGGINNSIMEMIKYHHERHNGTGYPYKLSELEIPLFARIGAIADCYDAMTSQRPYRDAISPSEAIRQLYDLRNLDFQMEIVEEFIQAIGIYPAGTIVELSTGEVGVVLAGYRTQRLRPKLAMVLDNNKHPLPNTHIIDLSTFTQDDKGNPVNIVRSLETNAYNIELEDLQIYS